MQDAVQHQVHFQDVDGFLTEKAQEAAFGAGADCVADFLFWNAAGAGDTGNLVFRGGGGNVGVQAAAGAGDEIHWDGGVAHVGVRCPEFLHPFRHQGLIFVAGGAQVRRDGVHKGVAVFAGVGGNVNVHDAAPEVAVVGELLSQKLRAVFLAVHFDDAAVGLMGENELGGSGDHAGVQNAADDGKNQENRR